MKSVPSRWKHHCALSPFSISLSLSHCSRCWIWWGWSCVWGLHCCLWTGLFPVRRCLRSFSVSLFSFVQCYLVASCCRWYLFGRVPPLYHSLAALAIPYSLDELQVYVHLSPGGFLSALTHRRVHMLTHTHPPTHNTKWLHCTCKEVRTGEVKAHRRSQITKIRLTFLSLFAVTCLDARWTLVLFNTRRDSN